MSCSTAAPGTGLAFLSSVPEEGETMKIRTMLGALVLGAGMLLGGSKTTEAGWVHPGVRGRVFVGFRGPVVYGSFYRPYAFRPYYAPFVGPRFVYRPYRPFYRPFGPVVYYRGW